MATLKKSKGFTLIELLIALVILSFALLALAGLMINTTNNNSFGGHMTEAATLAQDKLEELRAAAWGSLLSGMDSKVGATGISYSRSWSVASNLTDSLRTITITVSWNDRTSHSLRLVSAISQ